MTNSGTAEPTHVSAECFHAYVSAETKIPNTLIAVGPYVGFAALQLLAAEPDLGASVKKFANTCAFSHEQRASVFKAVAFMHGKFGVPVLPEGAELSENSGIRLFKPERFEVVYMEGVVNILQAILLLHGKERRKDGSLDHEVSELFEDANILSTTVKVFGAAVNAINSVEATEKAEVFKEIFNFTRSGEKPRAMRPAEKEAIQAEIMPFIIEAVRKVLVEVQVEISQEQIEKFVFVLTSPELYETTTN